MRQSQAAPGPRANADAPCLSPRKQVLAGAQAAVLAESEESLQELVMRDAEARADYRLRQNADDKGTLWERQMGKERVGRARRPSGWTRAWRAGARGLRFPHHAGGAEGPDHRTQGARGPGTRSGLGLPGRGRELAKVHLPSPGPGVCERTREKTRGFVPWRHSGCDDPHPRGDWRAFRELWAGSTENWAERQTGAGSPAGRGLRKRDSGPCSPSQPSE